MTHPGQSVHGVGATEEQEAGPVSNAAQAWQCENDHDMAAEGVYLSDGYAYCRACNREAFKRYKDGMRQLKARKRASDEQSR